MDESEKILLLDLILQDISINWVEDTVHLRLDTALQLAKDLGLSRFIDSIECFTIFVRDGDATNDFFRCSYHEGGFEGLAELHYLQYSISGRSTDFKRRVVDVLNFPDAILDDFELEVALIEIGED